MKNLFVICAIVGGFISHNGGAQDIYYTKNGHISFYSSTPVEDIKANNEKVTSIVNISTGEIEFSALIMAFQFEKALMQEHFNENYMESSKFPKSVFRGKIENADQLNFNKDGSYPVKVSGDITIHGVTKKLSTSGIFTVKNGKISSHAEFILKPEDFNIEIPNLVRDNIAKEIKVTVSNNYQLFSK